MGVEDALRDVCLKIAMSDASLKSSPPGQCMCAEREREREREREGGLMDHYVQRLLFSPIFVDCTFKIFVHTSTQVASALQTEQVKKNM